MASLIEAIDIKRKMFFEFEDAPYHCLEVEISKPTARGGQTLVRLKMRNLLTRAVFDKTFKAGRSSPSRTSTSWPRRSSTGTARATTSWTSRVSKRSRSAPNRAATTAILLVDNVLVQIQKYNGNPIGLQFPPHVELRVTSTEPGVRGDTASGGVTKVATLETGLEIRVPLFINEGEKVKVHTETLEFSGRA